MSAHNFGYAKRREMRSSSCIWKKFQWTMNNHAISSVLYTMDVITLQQNLRLKRTHQSRTFCILYTNIQVRLVYCAYTPSFSFIFAEFLNLRCCGTVYDRKELRSLFEIFKMSELNGSKYAQVMSLHKHWHPPQKYTTQRIDNYVKSAFKMIWTEQTLINMKHTIRNTVEYRWTTGIVRIGRMAKLKGLGVFYSLKIFSTE